MITYWGWVSTRAQFSNLILATCATATTAAAAFILHFSRWTRVDSFIARLVARSQRNFSNNQKEFSHFLNILSTITRNIENFSSSLLSIKKLNFYRKKIYWASVFILWLLIIKEWSRCANWESLLGSIGDEKYKIISELGSFLIGRRIAELSEFR